MTKDTGGPAFPAPAGVAHITEQGMTMRDYFASKCMQGILAGSGDEDGFVSYDADALAEQAYVMAEAMLVARGKS